MQWMHPNIQIGGSYSAVEHVRSDQDIWRESISQRLSVNKQQSESERGIEYSREIASDTDFDTR